MITYRLAEAVHIPQMTELWCRVFGDSPDYAAQFYAYWQEKGTFLIALDGDRVAGILHLLPTVLRCGEKKSAARYFYAGAVAPAYRRRGIYAELNRIVCRMSLRERLPVLLVPAEAGLFGYYERFGYRTVQTYGTLTVQKKSGIPADLTDLCDLVPGRLAGLTELVPCEMLWDTDAEAYAAAEIRADGGFAKQFTVCGADCAALGYCGDDILHLRALAAPDDLRSTVYSSLLHRFACDRLLCRVPPGSGADERKIGGLGIYMVKQSMDNVRYQYENGRNILTISKEWDN